VTTSLFIGCGKKEAPPEKAVAPAGTESPQQTAAPSAGSERANAAPVALPAPFGRRTDDLDGMLKRRNIRALVLINPISFFYSHGHPMGVNYEALRELESFINQKMKTGALKVKVTFIPLRPDEVEAALTQGVGDVIAYALVVTPERQQRVAFTAPLQTDVKQVVVSGPNFGDSF
jgi:extracellular solute-binding protein (family 3)